jgi:hypothetical protein
MDPIRIVRQAELNQSRVSQLITSSSSSPSTLTLISSWIDYDNLRRVSVPLDTHLTPQHLVELEYAYTTLGISIDPTSVQHIIQHIEHGQFLDQLKHEFILQVDKVVSVENAASLCRLGQMAKVLEMLQDENKIEMSGQQVVEMIDRVMSYESNQNSALKIRNELYTYLRIIARAQYAPEFRVVRLAFERLGELEQVSAPQIAYQKVKKILQKGILKDSKGVQFKLTKTKTDVKFLAAKFGSLKHLKSLEDSGDEDDIAESMKISAALESIMVFDESNKSIEIKLSGNTQENIVRLTREDLLYLDDVLRKKKFSFSPSSLGLAKVLLDNILSIFLEKNAPKFLFDQTVKLREQLSQEFYIELSSSGILVFNWASFGTKTHMDLLYKYFVKDLKISDCVSTEAIEHMLRKVIIFEPDTPDGELVRTELALQLKLLIESRKGDKSMSFASVQVHEVFSSLSKSQKIQGIDQLCVSVKEILKKKDPNP